MLAGSLGLPELKEGPQPTLWDPREEYWSGVPFLFPGDLPDPGIEPMSPVSPALAGGFFTTKPPGKLNR